MFVIVFFASNSVQAINFDDVLKQTIKEHQLGNYEQVIKINEKYIKSGGTHPFAFYNLANLYLWGPDDIEQDGRKAVQYFKLSIANGFTHYALKLDPYMLGAPETNLGYIYLTGEYPGVPKDEKKALEWTLRAVQHGKTDAHSNLALIYAMGFGVEKDYFASISQLIKSMEAFTTEDSWVLTFGDDWDKFLKDAPDFIWEARDLYWKYVKTENRFFINELKKLSNEIIIAETDKPYRKRKELDKPKDQRTPKLTQYSGSGFFISKLGHIITNEHVVKECKQITVGENIDRQVPARLVEVDRKNDLALLRTVSMDVGDTETESLIKKLSSQKSSIEIVPLTTVGLLRNNDVDLGEDIIVAGFPYGDIFSKDMKVTFGNVNSVKGVGDDSSQFQIQAPVQTGNSGGPIYDRHGNIVGVVVAQLNKLKLAKTIGSIPENVNFGIKASTVKQFLNSSGLPTKWANRTQKMSNKEISNIARKQTLMVLCHRE